MVEIHRSADAAVAHISDGDTVAVSGFGLAGQPTELIDALIRAGVTGLTVVANNAGNGETGLAKLLDNGAVSKMICSFPRQTDSQIFDRLYRAGKVELELVPQGTLAERLRAGGAGIGGFYTRTAAGTMLAAGKEVREFAGEEYVLEHALQVDAALIKADTADAVGNLTFRKTARNFGPVMAMAAAQTTVQVSHLLADQFVHPEHVVTPAIFVDHLVEITEDKE